MGDGEGERVEETVAIVDDIDDNVRNRVTQ